MNTAAPSTHASALRARWQALAPREQRLMLAASALVALALGCVSGQAQTAAPAAASAASAPTGPTVRAEMAAPLQAARELINGKKGKEALARLAEVDTLPNPSPYETYVIARMKAVAAVDAG